MEFSTLGTLIHFLENGTNIHICVLLFLENGDERLKLDYAHTIHPKPICEAMKNKEGGTDRCYRCRCYAIKRAIRRFKGFGAICVNGVFEYTQPIIFNNKVIGVIMVGNILPKERDRIINCGGRPYFSDIQADFSKAECERISKLVESYIIFLLQNKPQQKKNYDNDTENFIRYIETNLEYKIDLSLMAEIFGYNKKYLGRLFSKKVGMSLNEYVNKRRLEKSIALLKNGESVTNSALSVGFNNVTYYNKLFKNEYGITPSEYKKACKN